MRMSLCPMSSVWELWVAVERSLDAERKALVSELKSKGKSGRQGE
jgi:hypothetical protein